ncbi:MAG: L,D-transpeptidase family protein [Alphaproteobacteria bacterium]|nr:L,D-transpeptidase family protein [Alphaproteobacteria bacterium]
MLGLAMALAATPAMARDTKPLEPVAGDSAKAGATLLADAPLQILVSLKDQTLDVYRGTQLIESTRISSGKSGYGTPTGIFSILESGAAIFQYLRQCADALHAAPDVVGDRPARGGCRIIRPRMAASGCRAASPRISSARPSAAGM